MSFLAPLSLVLGAAAAAAVVALHLITTRRPPSAPLPTARFVPVAAAQAVARVSRPTDILLLALRALAVLLIGIAFARPVLDAAGPSVRTVVMLDVSRAVADPDAARARARAEIGEGGALVVFDTAAREWPVDSLAPDSLRAAYGALSPALVAARAAAARVARGADSVRLVVLSPLVEGAVDGATAPLRADWPGRIEVLRLEAVADTARGARAQLVTSLDDDPLAPTIASVRGVLGGHEVRIVRGATGMTAGDSMWVRGAPAGRVLVVWPATFDDSVVGAGVTTFGPRSVTVVAPLARLPLPLTGTATMARWNDGGPAVVQSALGDGCVRHVGIGVPLAGDLTLRAPFTRLVEAIVTPCGGQPGAPISDSALTWLSGDGPLASARVLAATGDNDTNHWPLVLLALAITLLIAELVVRRRAHVERAGMA